MANFNTTWNFCSGSTTMRRRHQITQSLALTLAMKRDSRHTKSSRIYLNQWLDHSSLWCKWHLILYQINQFCNQTSELVRIKVTTISIFLLNSLHIIYKITRRLSRQISNKSIHQFHNLNNITPEVAVWEDLDQLTIKLMNKGRLNSLT
jgi:flagellar biosynthesis regulator FlaF